MTSRWKTLSAVAGSAGGTFGNPEDPYGTPDYTITAFPSTGGGVSSGATDAIVAVDATIGASDTGIIFDLGGSGGSGFSAGVNNGTLRTRVFNSSGDSAWTDPATAYLEIDLTAYIGQFVTYYFVVDASAFTLNVYVKPGGSTGPQPLISLGTNTSNGAETDLYGSNDKGYGQDNTVADLTAAYEGNYSNPGNLSQIRYWAENAALDVGTFGEGLQDPGGGGGTNPVGLSPSLLSFSGTNDVWTTQNVNISSYANETVYLVFHYQNGNGFAGDIQLDNIQLDGTTYSFENVTHSFETSNNDNSSTYAGVSWTPVLIEADNNREGRWCVDSGGTPSNGTGRTDADAGTWYIYAETSGNAATAGYNIWLRSPLTTLSAAPTLQFAEARNGGDIGTLGVHLDVTDGGSTPPPANDVTPDAVDWSNATSDGSPSGSTNTQTITGINTTITLDVSFTQDRDQYTLEAFVNGVSAAGPTNSPGTLSFNVNNNDTVSFEGFINTDFSDDTDQSVATVTNASDGDAVLDTFGITLVS